MAHWVCDFCMCGRTDIGMLCLHPGQMPSAINLTLHFVTQTPKMSIFKIEYNLKRDVHV